MKPDHIVFGLIMALIVFVEITLGLSSIMLPAYFFFGAMLAIFFFIVICITPQWGLYVLIFTFSLNIGAFTFRNDLASSHLLETACSIPFSWLFVFPVIIAWLVRGASKLGHREHIQPTEIVVTELLLLIICWNAITLFWTPNLFEGSIQFVKLFVNIVLFYLFYCFIDSRDVLMRVAWAWLLLGLVLFVLSFFSIYGTGFVEQVGQSRFISFWKYAFKVTQFIDVKFEWRGHLARGTAMMSFNALPFLINVIIAFGLGLLLTTKREEIRKRSLLIIWLIFLVCSHLTSLSKGGLIGLFAMVFFFLVAVNRLRKKFFRNAFLFITGLPVLFVIIQVTRALISFSGYERLFGSTEAYSAPTRLAWWSEMLGLLFKKTFGIGLGIGASKFYLDPVPYIHSIYFSVLCDMGWIGTLLFSLLLGIIAKEVLQLIKYQETFIQNMLLAFCGAMVAILAHGSVDFHYNYTIIWIVMGIGMAVLRLMQEELINTTSISVEPSTAAARNQ